MIRIVRTSSDQKAKQPQAVFTLVANRVYTVGRKTCSISFEDDTSMSRLHAEIKVEHSIGNVTNPQLPPSFVVTDVGSKFGTFINNSGNVKMKASLREPQVLGVNDVFQFGLQWNVYKVEYTPLVVTTSKISGSAVKERLATLGGHLTFDWQHNSSLLVMESIILNIKVVSALFAAAPIVTPQYLEKYYQIVDTKGLIGDKKLELPKTSDYLPPITEKSLQGYENLFRPDPVRKKLLAGKLFLLEDGKAYKTYRTALIAGGASVRKISEATTNNLTHENTIIMGNNVQLAASRDAKIKTALDTYLLTGKRIVTEKEIGLAALEKSLSVNCNPRASLPIKIGDSQSDEPISSLNAPASQGSDIGKRAREDDDEIAAPSKRRSGAVMGTRDASAVSVSNTKSTKGKMPSCAKLFAMSDSDDDDDDDVLRKAEAFDPTCASSAYSRIVPTSPISENETQVSRGMATGTQLGAASSFLIHPTPAIVEDTIHSGMTQVIPASPDRFSEMDTLETFSCLEPKYSIPLRPKRKQDEDELSIIDVKPAMTRPQKKSKVEENWKTLEHVKNDTETCDDVPITVIGYTFESMVLKQKRPLQNADNLFPGIKNFKRFVKSTSIPTLSRSFSMIAHDQEIVELVNRNDALSTSSSVQAARHDRVQPSGHECLQEVAQEERQPAPSGPTIHTNSKHPTSGTLPAPPPAPMIRPSCRQRTRKNDVGPPPAPVISLPRSARSKATTTTDTIQNSDEEDDFAFID